MAANTSGQFSKLDVGRNVKTKATSQKARMNKDNIIIELKSSEKISFQKIRYDSHRSQGTIQQCPCRF